jgi:hypothetical protein
MSNDSIEKLIKEVQELRLEIKDMRVINDRMDNHINFVENVYEYVRVPFFTIMNMVTTLAMPLYPQLQDDSILRIDID